MRLIPMSDLDLWVRAKHPLFDVNRLYRVLAVADYQESGRAYFLLVNQNGYAYFVSQTKCIVSGKDFFTDPLAPSKLPAWPKGPVPSSFDLGEL